MTSTPNPRPPGSQPCGGDPVAAAAVALTTAVLTGAPASVTKAILADVDSDDLALALAGVVAYAVRETTGGERWLQRWGLLVAEGAC